MSLSARGRLALLATIAVGLALLLATWMPGLLGSIATEEPRRESLPVTSNQTTLPSAVGNALDRLPGAPPVGDTSPSFNVEGHIVWEDGGGPIQGASVLLFRAAASAAAPSTPSGLVDLEYLSDHGLVQDAVGVPPAPEHRPPLAVAISDELGRFRLPDVPRDSEHFVITYALGNGEPTASMMWRVTDGDPFITVPQLVRT